MRWKSTDIKKYIEAKEYIDTAVVPLIPFEMSNDTEIEKSSFQSEVLSIITNEMEKELTGRILLMPSYFYLKSIDMQSESKRLNLFVEAIMQQPLQNVFLITFDPSWKKIEKEVSGTLIWTPVIQNGDLHSKEMHTMIQSQVQQIRELIRSYW